MPRRHALSAYYFLSFAAFGAYLPFFPRWLEARSVRGVEMGVVLALLPIMGIVAPPIAGWLADALGVRGSLLRIASTLAALGFALVAWSVDAQDGSLRAPIVMFVASALFAAARSPIMLVADVLALESLGPARDRYGELRLFGSLGFIAAALGVGRFVDPTLPRALPWVIAGLFAASVLVSFSLPRSTTPLPALTRASVRGLMADWPFLFCLLLSQASHSAYDVCYSLQLRDLGVSGNRVGIAWAVGVFAEVLLLRKSAAILSRVAAKHLLVIGLAFAAIRWLGIAFVSGFWSALLLQPLHAFSFACVWIASVAITANDERLATARGIASAAMGIGGAIGLVLWSALYVIALGRAVFTGAALVAVAAATVAFVRRGTPSPS